MAKVTPILWKHKPNADGHFPIWLRVADRYRTLYHSTGEYIATRHWNPNSRRVRSSHPAAEDLNALIEHRLGLAQSERARLKRVGEPITAEDIKAAITASDSSRVTGDYLTYADRHVESFRLRGKIREYKRQKAVFAKLRAYAGRSLPFDRMTPRFLKDYETHLIGLGNKPSTVNSNFKVIRTAFYAAIREGEFPQERNPFFAHKLIKRNAPDRPKLTAEQIRAIEQVDLGGSGPSAPLIARARDLFLFSFYGAGIRFTDAALMRRSNLSFFEDDNGETQVVVDYSMGKTGKRSTVRMSPEAVSLVQAYCGRMSEDEDPFLFPFLDRYDTSTPEGLVRASGNQNVVVNKYLKLIKAEIEIQLNIPMPSQFSFHLSRHAWADLARKSGRDLYDLRDALKHSNMAVTEMYLANRASEVVDAEITSPE